MEAQVQYGPHFRGLLLYLFNQQILPFDRLRQTCADMPSDPSLSANPRSPWLRELDVGECRTKQDKAANLLDHPKDYEWPGFSWDGNGVLRPA